MSIIVTDTGFGPEDLYFGFCGPEDVTDDTPIPFGVDLASDADPEIARPFLDRALAIRVDFPSFADGRGFTIARRLRLMGYKGRLRARGHVIADQYAMARRSGFDEVEISEELAERQPEDQWLFRADWQAHDHQSRLRARA